MLAGSTQHLRHSRNSERLFSLSVLPLFVKINIQCAMSHRFFAIHLIKVTIEVATYRRVDARLSPGLRLGVTVMIVRSGYSHFAATFASSKS